MWHILTSAHNSLEFIEQVSMEWDAPASSSTLCVTEAFFPLMRGFTRVLLASSHRLSSKYIFPSLLITSSLLKANSRVKQWKQKTIDMGSCIQEQHFSADYETLSWRELNLDIIIKLGSQVILIEYWGIVDRFGPLKWLTAMIVQLVTHGWQIAIVGQERMSIFVITCYQPAMRIFSLAAFTGGNPLFLFNLPFTCYMSGKLKL